MRVPEWKLLSTPSCPRNRGALLIELTIALGILTVGILGFLYASQSNVRTVREVSLNDRVAMAFNQAREALLGEDFSQLYATHHNTLIDPLPLDSSGAGVAPGVADPLLDESGNPARVLVTFDVNETALPPQYGPLGDIDGDGELASTDCSGSYRVLPTRLTLTYETDRGPESRTVFLVLRDNSF